MAKIEEQKTPDDAAFHDICHLANLLERSALCPVIDNLCYTAMQSFGLSDSDQCCFKVTGIGVLMTIGNKQYGSTACSIPERLK